MKYSISLILFIGFFISLSSCREKAKSIANEEIATKEKPSASAVTTSNKLPSIPLDLMKKLFEECDYVDYLFYDSNFSMSMNNQNSIRSTLTHVSESTPDLNPNCKAIGRVFYEIQGNTEIEAEIFFSKDCQYFIFMKGNNKIYANNITADGVAHFNNIFSQASKMNQGNK